MLKNKLLTGANAIDAREAFDPEKRAAFMNASEADSCIRKQWYAKNISPDEEQSWGYARRGRAGERYIVECLRAANVDIRYALEEQESLTLGLISGTPDGVIVDEENNRLIGVEFKTIDPRVNRRKLPRDEHVTQLQLCMCLFDEHGDVLALPDYPMSHGIILYMDASNFDDIVEKVVPYEPELIENLQGRAEKILTAKSAGVLSKEGKAKGGYECKQRCPFSTTCLGEAEGPAPGKRRELGTVFERTVKKYTAAKLEEEKAKEEKSAYAEKIKDILKRGGLTHATVGGVEVSLTHVAGRKTLDKKAMADDGIDVEKYEKTGKPSERLTIS